MTRINFLMLLVFFLQPILNATELSPWFGNVLEPEARLSSRLQLYSSVDTKYGIKRRPEGDVFNDLSFLLAPTEDWSGELEAITADTRHHRFGVETFRFTGRYRWLNDIVGEPLSLSTGLTISQTFKPFQRDLAIFNHGGIECEAHVAGGKEFSCMQFWNSRVWAVYGVGIGDLGSAWMRGELVSDYNWWDRHQLRFFLHSLWGLGDHSLNLEKQFHGYGRIGHRSIDTGIRYSIDLESSVVLNVEYALRVYAKNCPRYANVFLIQIFYPFKL